MPKISRRKFLYAGTGLAVAAGIGYLTKDYWQPLTQNIAPKQTQTNEEIIENNPPHADFYIIKPKYNPPIVNQEVHLRSTSSDPNGDPIIHNLYVNDELFLETESKDLKFKFKESGTNRVKLEVTDGKLATDRSFDFTVDPDQIYPVKSLDVKYKGISYYIGTMGEWRIRQPKDDEMNEHLDVIHDDLGCNTVIITAGGNYEDRIIECGELAIEKGFERVYIQPRYFHATIDETVERLGEFAHKVRALRETSDKIVYSVGHEFGLESAIIEGDTWNDRLANQMKGGSWSKLRGALPAMFRRIIAVCNKNYGYSISYSAIGDWEHDVVPWGDPAFESIGVNAFLQNYFGWTEGWALNVFSRLKRFGKPVYTTDWGCMTYPGAGEYGGAAMHPQFLSGKAYYEEEQAEYIDRYCKMLNQAKIDGSFYGGFRDSPMIATVYPSYTLITAFGKRRLGFYMYKSYQRMGS